MTNLFMVLFWVCVALGCVSGWRFVSGEQYNDRYPLAAEAALFFLLALCVK